MQYAVEQALRHRRPAAVFIDEAQHLARVSSGRKLADQLDVLKSIASRTQTIHVLIGTYELLAFRNLSGQLSRRSTDLHFSRYHVEQDRDIQVFRNVVLTFQQQLPPEHALDLSDMWDFLYERSLGCVGILKDWLSRSLNTSCRAARPLSRRTLEQAALSASQCEKILAETREGENRLRRSGIQHSSPASSGTSRTLVRHPGHGHRDAGQAFRQAQAGCSAATARSDWPDRRGRCARMTYESWSCDRPVHFPKRSHLYQLRPFGVGTPLVESLTGYVCRLAVTPLCVGQCPDPAGDSSTSP